MMLSAAKYPFRTCLTIFARRNGSCLAVADDMRLQNNANSLIGLAVILPKNLTGSCQLAVLDTQVHKSEQFVEKGTIKVDFTGENHHFKSCVLMSNS